MVALIKKLPRESQLAREELGDMADWGHMPENLARLVDLMTAWLNYEYANWTADPDQVEEERLKRKRAKMRPPPFPLIQPVASRPASLHEELEEQYAEEAVQHQLPEVEAGPRMVDSDEFDAMIDRWF
jgi:hypothetical protein